MPDPLATINTRRPATPQTEQADPRQVANNAGGYTFQVDGLTRLRRFLTLSVDGGTYYASERAVTKDNAAVVLDWARNRTGELVTEIAAVSTAGRAPRNTPALFALAAAASLGDDTGRKAALDALPAVARTGTHLFQFAGYCEQFRGWGRGLRRAVAGWYLTPDVGKVAYQAVKYRQRDGWSHRDLLRLAHPETADPQRRALFDWITHGTATGFVDVPLVDSFVRAQVATTARQWVDLIAEQPAMSWEMLPDAALSHPEVWDALIAQGMPQTALMRQLPRLTRLGVLRPFSAALNTVTGQLADPERLRRGRVHPVNVLVALRTYASGMSARGDSVWTPVGQVIDALDAAFYAAFGAIEPAGKRTMLALDVSGSMGSLASGLPITCREASAALAMAVAATEPSHLTVGFTSISGFGWGGPAALTQLAISPRQRLNDVIATISGLPFGGTDCALPMLAATHNKFEVDTFVVFTDNDTYAGAAHPHEALNRYRQQSGIDARLIVVGMTATEFSIADPADPGMLDVAGFDSSVPNLIGDFSAGRL